MWLSLPIAGYAGEQPQGIDDAAGAAAPPDPGANAPQPDDAGTIPRPKLPAGAKLPPIPDRITPVRTTPYSAASADDPPPSLNTILSAPIVDIAPIDTTALQWEAIREGAIAYGMRAGFAAELFAHQRELEKRGSELRHTYDFARLVMPAPRGFLYEPGIVLEMTDAVTQTVDGQAAARAAQRFTIAADPRLISRPRQWEDYLVFDIEPPAPVHPALLPREGQQDRWREWVKEGWQQGQDQANRTIELLFAEMERDLQGMILWRTLLAEGRISAPLIDLSDRGITADKEGRDLRVGDVEVRIGDTSHLQRDPTRWRPLPFISAGPPAPIDTAVQGAPR